MYKSQLDRCQIFCCYDFNYLAIKAIRIAIIVNIKKAKYGNIIIGT
jgi:hypothetical protein